MDSQHQFSNYQLSEKEHRYGDNIHILSDAFLLSILARLCSPNTVQPEINRLTEMLYSNLIKIVVNNEFPRTSTRIATRMLSSNPEGMYVGQIIDPKTQAVVVALSRAGNWPSHIVYDRLNTILNPTQVRQAHITANRSTNEKEEVTGTDVFGQKIGGSTDNAIVLIPDPMGATGSTIETTLHTLANHGLPKKRIAVHLIITPEYVKKVREIAPSLIVYAIRLDRGLSTERALKSVPGIYPEEERGLNEKGYIIPGGGGFGEIMNNAEV